MIWRASVGFSSRNSASFGVDRRLDEAGDPRVAELRLRLALELRVLELDRDHGREALAHVLALEVVLLLLQQALVARVLVERARQRRAEARRCGCRPRRVLMLLANEKTDSWYEVFHCIATSA